MQSSTQWHVKRWPFSAWVETGLKLAACAVAFNVWLSPDGYTGSIVGSVRVIALVVLTAMTLGLCIAIYDRWLEKEIVSMAFVAPNLAGHAIVLGLLFTASRAGQGLAPFAGLMFLGDLAKLIYLHRSGFTVRDLSPRVLRRLTALYALGYIVLVLLPFA